MVGLITGLLWGYAIFMKHESFFLSNKCKYDIIMTQPGVEFWT